MSYTSTKLSQKEKGKVIQFVFILKFYHLSPILMFTF